MCVPAVAGALGLGGAGAAGAGAAAGAAAMTAGQALQMIGLVASIGGSLAQASTAASAARANVAAIEEQKIAEAKAISIEDRRTRARFAAQIAEQRAQLAARGIDMGSPTAVYLGQVAGKELSFASQSVRQTGVAKQNELTTAQRDYEARAKDAMLRGTLGAADTFLTSAPKIWPGLLK